MNLSMTRSFYDDCCLFLITIAHDRTLLVFGGLKDLADKLHIPNKYTGYIFLLDEDNRVRWRGSGRMSEEKGS